MQSNEPESLWSTKQVATYCSVASETVRRWRRDGKLGAAGKTPGGRWLYDPRDVQQMLRREAGLPEEPPPRAQPAPLKRLPGRQDPIVVDRQTVERHVVDSGRKVIDGIQGYSGKLLRWAQDNRGRTFTTAEVLKDLNSRYPDVARSNLRASSLSADLRRLREFLGLDCESKAGKRIWSL